MKRFLFAVCFLAVSQAALAQRMGRPDFQGRRFGRAPGEARPDRVMLTGNGCPAGGAVATLSDDGTQLSVLFDKMTTQIPPSPLMRQRVQCLVNLGVQFSGGSRVSVVGADVRGFVNVPQGSQTVMSIKHLAPGRMMRPMLRQMDVQQKFVGPRSEQVLLHAEVANGDWATCGPRGAALRAIPLMTVAITIDSINSNPTENLLATLDSLDVGSQATLVYNLAWDTDPAAAASPAQGR